MADYRPAERASMAYDVGGIHGSCADVQLIFGSASGVPWFYCPTCRVTGQIDVCGGFNILEHEVQNAR